MNSKGSSFKAAKASSMSGTPVPAVIGTDYKALKRMCEKKTVCNCHAHACRQFLPIGCSQKTDIDRQVVADNTLVLERYRHNAKRSLRGHWQIDVRIDRGRDVACDVGLRFARLDADLNEFIAYIKADRAGGSSRAGNRHGLGRRHAAFRIRKRHHVQHAGRILVAIGRHHAMQDRTMAEELGGLLSRGDISQLACGSLARRQHRPHDQRLHVIGRGVRGRVVHFRVEERRVDLLRDRVEKNRHECLRL